jgi:DNA-binding NarL/FixJ family response regulator
MPLRLLLADDHRVLRDSLRQLLERAGFQVVGVASNGLDAVRMARELAPDVAVLDIGMPTQNGLATAAELKKLAPEIRVVLLTMHADEAYVTEALRSGVLGYVLKSEATEDLIRALNEVKEGRAYLSPRVSRAVVEAVRNGGATPKDPLTPRERQVLQLVAEGQPTKAIAATLGISAKTAETHRGAIMRKLDIHDMAGLVRYALRNGLTQP